MYSIKQTHKIYVDQFGRQRDPVYGVYSIDLGDFIMNNMSLKSATAVASALNAEEIEDFDLSQTTIRYRNQQTIV